MSNDSGSGFITDRGTKTYFKSESIFVWGGGGMGGLTMMGIDSKLCFLAGKVQISNDILLDEEGG